METPQLPSLPAFMSRRVAPPCWSKEETLALVEAYKEKWFSLDRKNLRSSDWDDVCAAMSFASEPDTTKSSVQCRSKIEKLRQRFRAEKKRCVNKAGKFFSSWDLFPMLEAMNFVSDSVNASAEQDQIFNNKVGGVQPKLEDHGNFGSNLGFDHGFNGGYGSNFDPGHKFGGGYGNQLRGNRDFVAQDQIFNNKAGGGVHPKSKDHGNSGSNLGLDREFNGGYGSNFDPDHRFGSGYGAKTQGNRGFVAEGVKKFKSNGYGSAVDYDNDSDLEVYADEEMGFQAKVSGAWDSGHRGFHQKKSGGVDRSFDHGVDDHRGLNGFASSSRPRLAVKNGSGGVKRGVDPMEEIVSSIKFMGEEFVRMEKMKIEMMKDIEKTRVERELKNNQMILESQEKIIDVFAKALLE